LIGLGAFLTGSDRTRFQFEFGKIIKLDLCLDSDIRSRLWAFFFWFH